jgi:hypothetical protein
MTGHATDAGAGLRFARVYLAVVGLLLLVIGTVTILGHVARGLEGITLVFSQEAVDEVGGMGPAPTEGADRSSPPPVPADETVGGVQFVDLPSLALTLAGGGIATAGALVLGRRTPWSVPLGLAGAAVAVVVGFFPAALGIWAANFYAGSSDGQLLSYLLVSLLVSAVLVAAAIACAIAVWRRRDQLSRE